MTDQAPNEEYTYHVGNIDFVVTPIYKESGGPMCDILLKLVPAESGPA